MLGQSTFTLSSNSGKNRMRRSIERRINVVTILALALIAVFTSPKPITQLIAFVTMLSVVFGRDFLLKRPNVRTGGEAI